MAEFHWKGRTSGGQEVTGRLTAGSKEEVMASLRRQGLLVQSIEETRGGSDRIDYERDRGIVVAGGPPASSAVERLARARAQGPRRMRGFLIAMVFVAIGFGAGLLAPVITCRCERPADGVATCTLDESDLGVLPLRTQTLADVRSAEIETLSGGGASHQGRNENVPHVRLVLYSVDRASIQATTWGDDGLQAMRTDLVSWLLENRPGTFARRSVEWSALLIALIPMAIGVLMLLLLLLSFSRRVTDGIYAMTGAMAAAADARRGQRRANPNPHD